MEKQDANKMDINGGPMKFIKEQCEFDVWLKAEDQTDAIPANKLVLAAKSKVLSNILESDSSNQTITIPEMKTHDALEMFIQFMYRGSLEMLCSLPVERRIPVLKSLYSAGYKYDIPDLQDLCRNKLLFWMIPDNVRDILKLAETHADEILKYEVSCWKYFLVSDAFSRYGVIPAKI